MKKPNIVMTLMMEGSGYSATVSVKDIHINTEADSFDELKENILEAVNHSFEDKGWVYWADEIILKTGPSKLF